MPSTKAVLTGNFGVDKSSLFNRFIYQSFSDVYKLSIGVRIGKKTIIMDDQEANLILWDIEGKAHPQRVPTSYFLGATIILYFFDLATPLTFKNLSSDISYLQQLLPDTLIKLIANKCDLVSDEEIQQIQQELPYPIDLIISVKSGENVETLFQEIGHFILLAS